MAPRCISSRRTSTWLSLRAKSWGCRCGCARRHGLCSSTPYIRAPRPTTSPPLPNTSNATPVSRYRRRVERLSSRRESRSTRLRYLETGVAFDVFGNGGDVVGRGALMYGVLEHKPCRLAHPHRHPQLFALSDSQVDILHQDMHLGAII